MATKNVKMEVKGTKLIIEVDLTKDNGLSGSGKNTIIGTTGGNVEVKDGIMAGINIYKKA